MKTGKNSQGIYRLPDSLAEDLENLREIIDKFGKGEISEARFRAFRVPQGIYEQREAGKYMLRVRLPAGMILPQQMRSVAGVSKKYGNRIIHVTTRQDVQVHRVSLENMYPALAAFRQAGLSTKGGGGNTVRNITSCYDTGVCTTEIFDVSSYAVALTEFMLADPLSFELPRKYKIAFSGCSRDCAGATVSDVGFIAKRRNGKQGFSAYAGGGMGAYSKVGDLLEEFVPDGEVHLVAEAIKRVFDKHGNRKNKHQARLRFLIGKIGFAEFRRLYEKELLSLKDNPPRLPEARSPGPVGKTLQKKEVGAERSLQQGNGMLVAQKQRGYYMVQIPLTLGDIKAEVFHSLADIVETHGEGLLHTTQQQNLALSWVAESELPELLQGLDTLGLGGSRPAVLRDMVACAGASTCRLGICLSRGLAEALAGELSQDGLDLDSLGELKIYISGCPNACGRHPVAQIGFYGVARRVGSRLVPYYMLLLGGMVEEGKTRLAQPVSTIPAKNVPSFLAEYLRSFQNSNKYPDFEAFLDGKGRKIAEDLALSYMEVPEFGKDKNAYFDWGAEEIFSLAGRGPGECGAGVFDLIEVDLDTAADALKEKKLFTAVAAAARSLLVTRGEQPSDELQALELFKKYFLEQGLVDQQLEQVVRSAIHCASASDREEAFPGTVEEVALFVGAVKDLYQNMDSSLRFSTTVKKEQPAPVTSSRKTIADLSKDFRGVVCPLNFVKVKLALEQLESGQTLIVLLDEEGAKNVPGSVSSEGHEVLSITRESDHWQVFIRKA